MATGKSNMPTMKDVAREAGVSLGTVSKVINHIPVGDEYRIKVEDAISKLKYEINTYARGLKVQQTNMVTLIVPDVLNPFYASFAHFIESALYQKGYKLMLCCSNGIHEKEIEYLNLASQNKADGIITLTYSDIGAYIPENLPLVSFDRLFNNGFTPRVASDNHAGGVMATEKLIELGCMHPAFIRFCSTVPGEADKRIDGYLEVCRKYKIEPIMLDESDTDDCVHEMERFFDAHMVGGRLDFDGIFANTDAHAYEAVKLLRKRGIRVPDDIQVIGFDGIRKFGYPENDLFVSTICQPVAELAQTCVNTILAKDGSLIPSLTLLPVTYQYGGTTKS